MYVLVIFIISRSRRNKRCATNI